MAAGEKITVTIEIDLRKPGSLVSTDWSVVAWAEKGYISVTNKSGIKT